MQFTVTYSTKNGERTVECGNRSQLAIDTFRKQNMRSREVILWAAKPRKVKPQRGKKKVAQSFYKRHEIVISEKGTVEERRTKKLPELLKKEVWLEEPKPTRKQPKKKVAGDFTIEELLGIEEKKSRANVRTVKEMNVGDIFIRSDGEEFVRLGPSRIENTGTGVVESCESSCSGEVIGNRFGEVKKTIEQESRLYPNKKKEKRKASPERQPLEFKKNDKAKVRDKKGKLRKIRAERCFSRKNGEQVVWDAPHENTEVRGIVTPKKEKEKKQEPTTLLDEWGIDSL